MSLNLMATDEKDHILELVRFEDITEPEFNNGWWDLDVEESAINMLASQPRGQAIIGRGTASCEGVAIMLIVSQVVDGPYVVGLGTDTDAGNYIQARVTWSHEELGALIGEVLTSWIFCGHDYTLVGVEAPELP